MSLTDLKKSSNDKPSKKKFTIDEFISDAENYAQGTPEIVSSDPSSNKGNTTLSLAQAIAVAKKIENEKSLKPASNKPYRASTFTLSEEAIEQLHELSKETKLAKSHILRILIDELCNKEQHEQLEKLFNSKVP